MGYGLISGDAFFPFRIVVLAFAQQTAKVAASFVQYEAREGTPGRCAGADDSEANFAGGTVGVADETVCEVGKGKISMRAVFVRKVVIVFK